MSTPLPPPPPPWPPPPGYQEVRLQEKMQCLAMGTLPCAITVVLLDELADTCQPGGETVRGGRHVPARGCEIEGGQTRASQRVRE